MGADRNRLRSNRGRRVLCADGGAGRARRHRGGLRGGDDACLRAVAVAALLFVALKPRQPFVELLTIASYSSVILALRQVISTPIYYVQESIASPTTLVRFFGMLDEASPVARFLGVIDLFVVWYIVVLAIGVSVVSRRPTRRLALAFAGAYVVLALLAALVMAMSGGTA